MYTNATSLVNKWDDFNSWIQVNDFPHFIMVTETWFNANSIKVVPNCTLFNKDRSQVIGDGVAIYLRDDVEACEVGDPELRSIVGERIWCKVLTGEYSLLLGCIHLFELEMDSPSISCRK
jgi:hypothetical protein